MTIQQNSSISRLPGAPFLSLVNAEATPKTAMVATGIVWGWRDDYQRPLIIKTIHGIHFACGGLSNNQRCSAMASGSVGLSVDFYHDGLDPFNKPINPRFKTLVIDRDGGAL